jgi:hypothetical protein
MKKRGIILLVLLALAALAGCQQEAEEEPEVLTEYAYQELRLQLPEGLSAPSDTAGFDYELTGKGMGVYVMQILKAELEQYGFSQQAAPADLVAALSKDHTVLDSGAAETYQWFTYRATASDTEQFYYLTAVYDTEPSFWIVNFACNLSDQELFAEKFAGYAAAVSFTEVEANR